MNRRILIFIAIIVFCLLISFVILSEFNKQNESLTIIQPKLKWSEDPGLEYQIVVLDTVSMPLENSEKPVPNSSYRAKYYVINHLSRVLEGPFTGSSFPNDYDLDKDTGKRFYYNTIKEGRHFIANNYGHNYTNDSFRSRAINVIRGSCMKDVIIDESNKNRYADGYKKDFADCCMTYVNIHRGNADMGLYKSRGSGGCPTLPPREFKKFMNCFDSTYTIESSYVGNLSGLINIYREEKHFLDSIENLILFSYED